MALASAKHPSRRNDVCAWPPAHRQEGTPGIPVGEAEGRSLEAEVAWLVLEVGVSCVRGDGQASQFLHLAGVKLFG